ncbi:MAG: Fic family protein [Zoogloea oleivorans]|jgi:hypothetical protein|uniref:Fic family protein n=1 Tax=Zoogloea oleivorans TaxID=1552750 RepID=UPI002A3711B3|nr:Fic family protein [Zoogloea oleivorans]MDY0038526.1 Fic family protein [Zoogloea oleivorans]
MGSVGYAYLKQQLHLSAFGPERAAALAPVTRITRTADAVLVPPHVAPGSAEHLEHLLFALKHEGIDLQLLAQSLRAIPASTMQQAVRAAPSGKYIRLACYLWEAFNRQTLEDLPPPPAWVPDLMEELLAFINTAPERFYPLVSAAIAAFGFVFIHPFMDGNGRLSRFLFHYARCQSGVMPNGMLLPVSVAMKRNEEGYLKALQSYSLPMRQRWDVRWIADDEYDLRYRADDTLYRYWDATACVEFGLEMARQALEKDLREETGFLARYDRIYKAVNERFDIRGNDLTVLVLSCLQNNGRVSTNRRRQYAARVPEAAFDAIEEAWHDAAE